MSTQIEIIDSNAVPCEKYRRETVKIIAIKNTTENNVKDQPQLQNTTQNKTRLIHIGSRP